MKKHFISIPITLDLTNDKNWEKLDDRDTKFFIMRLHFMLKVRQVENEFKDGGVLNIVEAPELVSQERVISVEIEKEYVNFHETLSSSVIEKESIKELMSELLVESNIPTFSKIRTGLKTKLAKKITENVTKTFKEGNTTRETKRVTFKTTTTFNEQQNEKIYQIKQYQKNSFDIYLSFIDYLHIDYSTSFFGLRRKRKKRPRIDNTNIHKRTNVLKLNYPIASIHFWKLMENSSVFRKASEYINQVPNPDEQIVLQPEDMCRYHVAIPKNLPSLYKLSNIAFPVKWVERNCDKSKLNLEQIEEEDFIIKWGNGKK